eukprot:SAG11_NODE_28324_length_323_cov_0.625000_1_plen_49_part_10
MAEKGVKMAMKMALLSDGFIPVRAGLIGSAWHMRAIVPALRRGGNLELT